MDRTYSFGEIVARIVLADMMGRAALRGYFRHPEGFGREADAYCGSRKAIRACYNAMFEADRLAQPSLARQMAVGSAIG